MSLDIAKYPHAWGWSGQVDAKKNQPWLKATALKELI